MFKTMIKSFNSSFVHNVKNNLFVCLTKIIFITTPVITYTG